MRYLNWCCEKRLLASLCMSVRPSLSVCMLWTAVLPPQKFSWNFSFGFSLKQSTNSDFVYNRTKIPDTSCMKSYEHFCLGENVFMVVTKPCFLWDTGVRPKKYLTIWAQQSDMIKVGCPSVAEISRNLTYEYLPSHFLLKVVKNLKYRAFRIFTKTVYRVRFCS